MRLISPDGMWIEQEDIYARIFGISPEGRIQKGSYLAFFIKMSFVFVILFYLKSFFSHESLFGIILSLGMFVLLGYIALEVIRLFNKNSDFVRISIFTAASLLSLFILSFI